MHLRSRKLALFGICNDKNFAPKTSIPQRCERNLFQLPVMTDVFYDWISDRDEKAFTPDCNPVNTFQNMGN